MNNYLKLLLSLFLPSFFIILFVLCFCNYLHKIKQKESSLDYYNMTEQDFDKLCIKDRWKYRSKCLEYFKNFKQDYSQKNYIYPLPSIDNFKKNKI